MPGGVIPLETERPLGPRKWCPVWCMMDPPASLALFRENGGSQPNNSAYRDCVPGGLVPANPILPCGGLGCRTLDGAPSDGLEMANPMYTHGPQPRYDNIHHPTPALCSLRADATDPLARPCGPADPYCASWLPPDIAYGPCGTGQTSCGHERNWL